MTIAAPSATGSLEKSPVLHLLVSALERQTSGTLVFESAGGQRSALLLNRGVPTKIKIAEPIETLGSVLVSLGWLAASDGESSYKESVARGILHGEYLVQTGMVSADTVARALRTQTLRKLLWLNRLEPGTAFGLYEGQDFLSRWAGAGTPVSPLRAVWYLGANSSDSPFCSLVVTRLASQTLRLHGDAILEKFGFDSAERALLDVLKAKPQTIGDLVNLQVLPPQTVHSLVYILALTHHLDLGGSTRVLSVGTAFDQIHELLERRRSQSSRAVVIGVRPATSDEPKSAGEHVTTRASPPAPVTDREVLEKRQQLIALSESEANLDHYQLLGVPRSATAEEIQQSFFKLAKLVHPDRLGRELSDLREIASRLFARLTQAQQCLSDKVQRSAYDSQLVKGRGSEDDEQHRIQAVIQAATSFQKAEVLFKKRMFAAAELEAEQAQKSDPDQADYLALLAWIRANKPNTEHLLPEILDQLNTALRMDQGSERTHFYRAQVLSRLGRQREALADYRFVVTKNPHHIDALREIRIWEMRNKGRDTLPSGGSLKRNSSLPAPGPSRRPSDPKHAARISHTPAPNRGSAQPPKTGVLGKLFKR